MSLKLVSRNSHKLIIIEFLCFLTKMLFKKFLTWAFWGHDVGPGWVRNGTKGCFHTSHITINPAFPKNKVLYSHSLLTPTLRKLKD